jgi:hypothetical protein
MIDWLIIGGGIHGTYLSNLLLQRKTLSHDDIRVIDPHPVPLSDWIRNTRNCGVDYLRSPATHNIDIGIMALHQFARTDAGRPHADFIPPYYRPALSLFQKHCRAVIECRRLDRLRVQARATAMKKLGGAIGVDTTRGELRARNVILAIGQGEQPRWPQWALQLHAQGERVHHVFDSGFDCAQLGDQARTLIVGGGISALQTALKLDNMLQGEITVLSRHPLRRSNYDFDPCWIGPKCLRGFHQTPVARRRPLIDHARLNGTAPEEVVERFNELVDRGALQFRVGTVREAVCKEGRIGISIDGKPLPVDQIVLATGFSRQRPGGRFIDQTIREFELKSGHCGYPITDANLRWRENLFVTGPLGELQLGPCARNIVGARNAGRYILQAITGN